jgi:malate dehydrogenase
MSVAAILGAGDIGAAVAERLARRGRFRAVRLIDADLNVATGKALDILQSGPVHGFDTDVSAAGDALAASGASAIVIADEVGGGEWEGERGLGLVRQIVRAGMTAPLVLAGPQQIWLLEKACAELGVDAGRLVGTAPSALAAAARALAGLELDASGADVDLAVAGRPPALVVGWSAATSAGTLLVDRVAAHRLVAVTQSIRRMWPPGPQAVAAATAPIVEALVFGSRRLHPALAIRDGVAGAREQATMLLVSLGRGRILERVIPSLSPQERTEAGL